MLTKAWRKIDRFYAILALVMLFLAVPIIFTIQGVFTSFITAYEVGLGDDTSVRVNEVQLENSINIVYEREVPDLRVRESGIIIEEE